MTPKKKQKKRCNCGEPSLPGLRGSSPPCAYEWARANWGTEWANRVYPNHPHALKMKVLTR